MTVRELLNANILGGGIIIKANNGCGFAGNKLNGTEQGKWKTEEYFDEEISYINELRYCWIIVLRKTLEELKGE